MDVPLNLVAKLEQLTGAIGFKEFYYFSFYSTLDQPGSNHHVELLALRYGDAQL